VDFAELSRQVTIARFDGDRTPLGHGVARVDRQVHENLFHLTRVGMYVGQILSRQNFQLDVFADDTADHLHQIRNHAIEIEILGLDVLTTAEGEQLAREHGAFLRRHANLLDVFVGGVFGRQRFLDELHVGDDRL
jgi:hypothetical protein